MEEAEPAGLSLSLDDIITQKGKEHRQHRQYSGRDYGHRRGGGGYRHHDRPQQSHMQQPYFNNTRGRYRQKAPASYRKRQRCYLEESTGTTVYSLYDKDLIRITPAGDITLDTNGEYTDRVLSTLNDALNPLGIRVTAPGNDVKGGQWSISDGKSLQRFSDGVVIPSKGPQHVGRAASMMEAFENPNRRVTAAATANSNAIAASLGILPGRLGYALPPAPPPRRGGHFAPY